VKVLDFGFAKLLELERAAQVAQLTRVGTCFGTPHYMSPEQTRARPLDARSDLFALGVIAYELVGGKRPWDGSNPRDVMIGVASKPTPKLDALRPDLTDRRAQLDAFFVRALAKEPAERFQTARELSLEFERALGSLVEMPANVPEEWYSELSSRVLSFGDLLGPVAQVEALKKQSRAKQSAVDADSTIISAWHQPLDLSGPIRVDGSGRPPSDTVRDMPVAATPPVEPTAKVKVSEASEPPMRPRPYDVTGQVRLPPPETSSSRRAREQASRAATGPAPPPTWLIVALVVLVLVGLALLVLR
jgi:serine/threonine-protein kinase